MREREREIHYIFSSHLGLIRCLTLARVSSMIVIETFIDESNNTLYVILPHELSMVVA